MMSRQVPLAKKVLKIKMKDNNDIENDDISKR